MPTSAISKVCFVGAGTMGCFNALIAALSGYQVTLYDHNSDALGRVHQRHNELAGMLVAQGYCQAEDIPKAILRVSLCSNLTEALFEVDLVSESVFERLDIKRDVHRQLDSLCSPQIIITTNSSVLLASDMADVFEHRGRFAALHTHLGAPLVDIVATSATTPDVVETLRAYVKSVGGVPLILAKEHPGYVLNSMLGTVLRTAQTLYAVNDIPIETIDRAWIMTRSAPMGPFGMMDLFGVDVVCDGRRNRRDELDLPAQKAAVLALLEPMVTAGHLGMKTGQGFYCYPNPAYQRAEFLTGNIDANVVHTLTTGLIASGVLVAARGVVDPAAVDLAWTVGTYLDTGPFALLADMGQASFITALKQEVASNRFSAEEAKELMHFLSETEASSLEKGTG